MFSTPSNLTGGEILPVNRNASARSDLFRPISLDAITASPVEMMEG